MPESTEIEIDGCVGRIHVRSWPNATASHIVLIAHGYGEHIGRYEHVAERLVADGAAVYGPITSATGARRASAPSSSEVRT